MDIAAWVDLLVKTFGSLGALLAGVALLFKWLVPRYEARTQQVIDAYKEQIEAYKAQLEEAKQQIEAATKERKELTEKFLETMSTCIAKSNAVLQDLVAKVEALQDWRKSASNE